MLFTIDAKPFAAALRQVSRVISGIPILDCVLVQAGSDRVWLTATDQDLELSVSVPASITDPGTDIALPCKELLGVLPTSGAVAFWSDGQKAKIEASGGAAEIRCKVVANFSRLEDHAPFVSLPASGLRSAFARVAHAISSEKTRYYPNGVYLASDGRKFDVVAIDGHRLAKVAMPAPGPVMSNVIVPRKAVNLIVKLGEVERAEIGQCRSLFAGRGWQLVTKMIDGTYPDYERVIPQNNPSKCRVVAKELAAALPRVPRFNAGVELRINGAIGVHREQSEPAMVWDREVAAETTLPADETAIGFNANYLRDTLTQFPGVCEMAFSDAASPVVFSDGSDFLAVVMPMRVR